MDEQGVKRCYATINLGNMGVVTCEKIKHSSDEQHYSHKQNMRWLDGEGFKSLVNGDGDVVDDRTPSEHSPEPLPRDQVVGGALRRGLSQAEGADVDGDVESAARRLVSAIRAESDRKLESAHAANVKLLKENQRLEKIILDAGSVITAAVGSIGEPREWSVKAKPRYRETFLGPKRARLWNQIANYWTSGSFDARSVVSLLGIKYSAAASLLSAAAREGKAERVSKGVYRVARKVEDRYPDYPMPGADGQA